VVSYHRTRRSRSALAYGSRSTATTETNSTGSYTTSGDATPVAFATPTIVLPALSGSLSS